jgi:hypothetical protein
VRGAVALELAAVFPLIGWFVFIPVTFIMALGAFLFALVGWMPRPAPRSGAVATTQEVSASV